MERLETSSAPSQRNLLVIDSLEDTLIAELQRPSETHNVSGLEITWRFNQSNNVTGRRFAYVMGHRVASVSLGQDNLACVSLRFAMQRYHSPDTWACFYDKLYRSVRAAEKAVEQKIEKNAAILLDNISALSKEPYA